MCTPVILDADVIGTRVVIVARRGVARHTFSQIAFIACGARVTVFTGTAVWCVQASAVDIAVILCAWVTIRAVQQHGTGLTHFIGAFVAYGAKIAIFASALLSGVYASLAFDAAVGGAWISVATCAALLACAESGVADVIPRTLEAIVTAGTVAGRPAVGLNGSDACFTDVCRIQFTVGVALA